MGLSTVCIGILPTYSTIGIAAPLLLALCRFGQGIGLGGEWGGAVLLATENAPPGKRAWYGMFPQLGAPVGFLFSGGVFLFLSSVLTDAQFFSYGWRIPFLASAILVLLGLYVRLSITETPVFAEAVSKQTRVKVPVVEVFRHHWRTLIVGIMISMVAYTFFYMMSVFTLSWGTTALGYTRQQFLMMQLFGILFFAATIPMAGRLAESGRRRAMIGMVSLAIAYGFVFAPMFSSGTVGTLLTLAIGFGMTGLVYGPLGTMLSELFPTSVRYTGSSIAFNVAGIFGASLAPYAATYLATNYGLQYVGYYISGVALLSLVGLILTKETKDTDLRH
jgi:MFS family permease